MDKIDIKQKFQLFSEYWTPKIIGEANGQYIKLAKAQGEMIWHSHEHEDEIFLVFDGVLTIQFRDDEVSLEAGELFIVPKGVEHRTLAREEAHFMMIELKSTAHTGEIQSEVTVAIERQQWI
jgi:mannose-6-phosphate isomerase-like protein (cupin superfamily)